MTDTERKTELVRKRGTIKSRLTLFENHVKRIKDSKQNDKIILSEQELLALEMKIKKCEPLLDEFERIQEQYECIVEEAALTVELKERENFEKAYYDAICTAKDIFLSLKKPDNNPTELVDVSSLHGEINSVNLNSIKLPTISLPKFEGHYENWIEFRDTFSSLIHVNTSINEIQKFHYLKACLLGSAANVIQSLELSSTNYNIAWDTLCGRYDNTNLLVHNHVKALFNLEPITKESSSKIRKLVDTVAKHLRSLKSLNEATDSWDTLIIFLITSKMDSATEQEWEKYKAGKGSPTLQHMYSFLKVRADILETIELSRENKQTKLKTFSKEKSSQSRSLLSVSVTCAFCNGKHPLYLCDEFQKLNCNERGNKVRELRLCINCFRPGHINRYCKLRGCGKCYKKHNTLLHVDATQQNVEEAPTNVALSVYNSKNNLILLATVSLIVFDSNHKPHQIRAVLDSGSQSNIISMSCYRKLNLNSIKTDLSIVGINGNASHSSDQCEVVINSIHGSFSSKLRCAILPEIPGCFPNIKLDINKFNIPKNLQLADPSFTIPSKVDILIGSGAFWNLICGEQIKFGTNHPILQKTKFGWVVAGPTEGLSNKSFCNLIRSESSKDICNVQNQLAKFWEIEEIPKGKLLSPEEVECENHFLENHSRDKDGRFIVTIPFKISENSLGDSKDLALKRFYSLERRLSKFPEMKGRYVDFMSEYESLGHMTEVNDNPDGAVLYYMPHHGVYRDDRETTKLRVVFDGSAPSSTGVSVNDLEMLGPVIQDDLFSIVIRFRKYPYVISADIEKMYRQVLISPGQRNLQRILWRPDPSQPIRVYALNTVTYGRTAASFLAIRSLHQLALECKEEFPQISDIIKKHFYVDDLICGSESIAEASNICKGVTEVLKRGCFELKKWVSNDPRCLSNIPQSNWSSSVLTFDADSKAKTLGLTWSCESDNLSYAVHCAPYNHVATKRVMLSITSQIFDPLGLVSPCIIIAKIMLQKLWLKKLEWDEPLPEDINLYWTKFYRELPDLNSLSIRRHVLCKNLERVEIHAFCDACEGAYGGCIYLRSTDNEGKVYTHLLCSKSKVSPLKPLTIPRLELSGALVVARLFNKVVSALNIEFDNCIFWSDSTIVLGWLRTSPNLLQTFVGNRVSEIIDLTRHGVWRHVPTNQNPADILSRGLNPNALADCALWWNGPEWLSNEPSKWPELHSNTPKLPELRSKVQNCLASINSSDIFQVKAYSKLSKLQRVVAYCLRFIRNCRVKGQNKNDRTKGILNLKELQGALIYLTRLAQQEVFGTKFQAFQNQYSKLLPFKDKDGIIRVGGRLGNASIPLNKKHPPILPGKHPLTKLLFDHEHILLLHSGPQMLLASVRQNFWPLSGRSLARQTVHKCITCFRANPKGVNPLMGNLPRHRVEPAPPFNISGVDYAGPFLLKNKKGRGSQVSKCYVSLFVCFVTKAVHLELVTDLTSSSFIMALKRFVSRRGLPSHIYSDNGTNFVGARSELKELGKFLNKNKESIAESLACIDINWHFIPARTPHFGGLWEAGIRSMKTHFKRVAGNSSLTFEEMYTLLVQIEAILNSRPISPMSSDPNDQTPLTPAHFLIGQPLTELPDLDYSEVPEHRLNRFQRIQQLKQQFWSRWSKEYLVELQGRSKWTKPQINLKRGDLVIIKEDNQPPMKWNLGRVLELHPGSDDIVRVVSLKTKNGVVKRGVAKLCALPLND